MTGFLNRWTMSSFQVCRKIFLVLIFTILFGWKIRIFWLIFVFQLFKLDTSVPASCFWVLSVPRAEKRLRTTGLWNEFILSWLSCWKIYRNCFNIETFIEYHSFSDKKKRTASSCNAVQIKITLLHKSTHFKKRTKILAFIKHIIKFRRKKRFLLF